MTPPLSSEPANALPAREQLYQLLADVTAVAIRLKAGRRPRDTSDLPPAARAVLQLLHARGPLTVPAIARARGSSRQNIQSMVNRLRRAGWLDSTGNPAHKRSGLIAITSRGEAALERGASHESALLEAVLSALPDTDLASAAHLLSRIRQALEQHRTLSSRSGRPSPAPRSAAQAADNPQSELPVNLL